MNKLLSGEELFEQLQQQELSKALPLKGPKQITPSGSEEEKQDLQNFYDDFAADLAKQRVKSANSFSYGEWLPDRKLIKLTISKGKFWRHMGFSEKNENYLYPEEGLFLLDEGVLQILYGDVPLSLEEGYHMIFSECISCEYYQVYANLTRQGFILKRHQKCSEAKDYSPQPSEYEKQLGIASTSKQSKKRKKDSTSSHSEEHSSTKKQMMLEDIASKEIDIYDFSKTSITDDNFAESSCPSPDCTQPCKYTPSKSPCEQSSSACQPHEQRLSESDLDEQRVSNCHPDEQSVSKSHPHEESVSKSHPNEQSVSESHTHEQSVTVSEFHLSFSESNLHEQRVSETHSHEQSARESHLSYSEAHPHEPRVSEFHQTTRLSTDDYCQWDFTAIRFPDISSHLHTDHKITIDLQNTALIPHGIRPTQLIYNINLDNLFSSRRPAEKFTGKVCDLRRSSARNWGEYKRELATSNNDLDILKSSELGPLWEGDVTPLIRPSDAVSLKGVLEKLQIFQTNPQTLQLIETDVNGWHIAFDGYLPDSKFKKSAGQAPDFCIALSRDCQDPPSTAEILKLCAAERVPLYWACVDNGNVNFYSFNSVSLPTML